MVHEKNLWFPHLLHSMSFRPRNTKHLHELRTPTVSPWTEPTAGSVTPAAFHTDRSIECTEKWPEIPRAIQIHHRVEWLGKSSNQIIRWRVVYKLKLSSYIIWQYSCFFCFRRLLKAIKIFWRKLFLFSTKPLHRESPRDSDLVKYEVYCRIYMDILIITGDINEKAWLRTIDNNTVHFTKKKSTKDTCQMLRNPLWLGNGITRDFNFLFLMYFNFCIFVN